MAWYPLLTLVTRKPSASSVLFMRSWVSGRSCGMGRMCVWPALARGIGNQHAVGLHTSCWLARCPAVTAQRLACHGAPANPRP